VLLNAIPDLAADATFDLFGADWLERYWKRVVMEVQDGLSDDSVLAWAAGATASGFTALLVQHFHIPEGAIPAAIAMTILIIRTAKKEQRGAKPADATEKLKSK
jgi:hypothetical protein